MLNYKLGEKQTETIKQFLKGSLDIASFKQTIGGWKSNADNALAFLNNPYFYGINFTNQPCAQYAALPATPFYNHYLFLRMAFFALSEQIEVDTFTHTYRDTFAANKPVYKNEEQVAVQFLQGELTFDDYAKQIKAFSNHTAFLAQTNSYVLDEDVKKYNLNNFEASTFEEVYSYHVCLYQHAIQLGMQVFPSFYFSQVSSLVVNKTLRYESSGNNLMDNLRKHLYGLLKSNLEYAGIEEKVDKAIEAYLPTRPTTHQDYYLVKYVDWPMEQGRMFDLAAITRSGDNVEFCFKSPVSNAVITRTHLDKSRIEQLSKEQSTNQGLVNMKLFAEGKAEAFKDVLYALEKYGFSEYDYESDFVKHVYSSKSALNFESNVRTRLQFFFVCKKVLKKHKVKFTETDKYLTEYMHQRNQKAAGFELFIDFVEGIISPEEFAQKAKNHKEFCQTYLSKNIIYFGNRLECKLLHRRLNQVLQKLSFNTYDRYLFEQAAQIFLQQNDVVFYKQFNYYDDYKKLIKYGLNYVNDSIMFDYLEQFLSEKPNELQTDKQIEPYIKGKLKELYSCQKSPPQWIEGPDWPYAKNGKPLHYLSAKVVRPYFEHKMFLFVNQESGEQVSIEQGAPEEDE